MRVIKKIIAWTAGLIAGLFVLVLLVILSLPHLVNLEAVKQRIINTVSSETGSQLTYSRVEILYLPRPSVTLEQATLSAPDNFMISLSSLRVYPEIVGLLKGQIQLAALHVVNPRLTWRASSPAGKTNGKWRSIPAETVRTAVASLLAIPAFQTPGFRIRVKNGRLSFSSAGGSEIDFQFINARLHRTAEKLRVKLSCTSNLGRKVTVSAHLLPDSLKAFAAVRVLEFRPHLLLDRRQMQRFSPVVDSRVDLDLKLQLTAARRLRIELNAADPFVRFQWPGRETILKSRSIKAVANIGKDTTLFSFSGLKLDQPGLQVSGSLFFNRSDPEIRVDLSAGGVDVGALRQAALSLMGHDKTVRDIFTILNGGHVPIVTIHATGRSLADLSDVENYIIRGNISGGDIFIPGAALQISNVKGEASIAGGLLRGTNISAQLGNSSGKNGQLTFGLVGGDAPFHLDIHTLADVAQLPPVLMRLVGSKAFTNELKKVVYVSGTAEGQLVIGERLDDLQVTASVTKAHVFAEYARITYPVVLSGGRYLFHSTRCVVDKINARIGGTELRNLSMSLDWSKNGTMAVSGGPAHFEVVELTEWLKTLDPLQSKLHALQFLDGIVSLSGFGIEGPLHRVQQWRYEFSGEVAHLGFRPAPLPDAVWVETARFAAEPAGASEIQLQVPESRIRWGSSRLQFSGKARISTTGADLEADLTIDEVSGKQISQLAGTEPAGSAGKSKRDFWPRWLEGVLRVTADRFRLGDLTFTPVEAGVILHPGTMTVKIHRADYCGISVPGLLEISPWKLAFTAEPETTGTQLDVLFTCFFQEPGVVTGTYEMAGRVTADSLSDGFYPSLDGHLQFTSRSGRIYRHGILAKVLALLNMTEIFRGRLPDVVQKGFGYETMKISGEFEDGKLVLRKGIIDGSSMTIVFEGSYDLLEQTLDIDMLVAPLKTIDAILQNLPLVNNIMKSGLVSIPFRVEGRWDSIEVRPVPAEETETELLRTLNRSLDAESQPAQPLPLKPRVDPGLLGK